MPYDPALADRVMDALTARRVTFSKKAMFGGLCVMVDEKKVHVSAHSCGGIRALDVVAVHAKNRMLNLKLPSEVLAVAHMSLDEVRLELAVAPWLIRHSVTRTDMVQALTLALGKGEAEAIVLAQELDADVPTKPRQKPRGQYAACALSKAWP